MRYNEDQNEKYKQAVRKGSVAVELTNYINELTEGRYGVDEALNKVSSIIKRCMERAFGNKQAKPTGASWWNAECETAKLMFRQAHRRDSINIHRVGVDALRLSAETVALRNTCRNVKKKARLRHEMENAELIASFFHDPRIFWRDF